MSDADLIARAAPVRLPKPDRDRLRAAIPQSVLDALRDRYQKVSTMPA
jgi:hypothetical protein